MKKQLTAVLLVFALLLTVTGCTAAEVVEKISRAEERIEENLDATEARLERRLEQALKPAPAVETATELTEEQARQIALDHAGFTAEQVQILRTEYQRDDGVPLFEVELYQGDWEYEFEIHAQNGHLLSYDKDHRFD